LSPALLQGAQEAGVTSCQDTELKIQAALVQRLRDPACYPHPVDCVEHIETHISHVLLAGDYAYKIKKPVALGFLDFSTLSARRFYCEEELRLNHRFAPQLYLEVIGIGSHSGAPTMGVRLDTANNPDTGAVEYALKMRRFPQENLFNRLAQSGILADTHIDSLAAVVARFHEAAPRAGLADSYGGARAIEAPMRQNFEQLQSLLADEQELALLSAIENWSRKSHATLTPVFEVRRAEGWVRECHGDLHLGNVAWVDEAALPFDCIEFDANLRWIDVQNEIAFAVMDLYARGSEALALRLLNAYLGRTGDYAGLAVFDVYLVYRAMVRAKVARLRATGEQGDTAVESERDFALHLKLADRFTKPKARVLIVMQGLSGSGKSVLSEALYVAIGALRLRSDVERKRVAGLDLEAPSGSAIGTDLYSEGATLATYAELTLSARQILEAGWPVIIDAANLERWQRETFRALARELAIPFLIVTCDADEAVLRSRITRRQAIGGDASEADLAVLDHQLKTAEALGVEEQPLLRVDTGRELSAQSVARIKAALAPINVTGDRIRR
jgi:aminoglycoside phosphotransferase family enzyme/predicted kinase